MNIDLFSQNLALLVCAVGAGLLTYLLLQLERRWYYKYGAYVIGASLVLAVLFQVETGAITQSADELPTDFWLLVLPFTFSLTMLAALVVSRWSMLKRLADRRNKAARRKFYIEQQRSRKLFAVSGAMVVCAFLLSGLVVNDYYQYFPTISSVFGGVVGGQGNHVDLQFSGGTAQRHTIEASLNNQNPQVSGRVYSVQIPAPASHFAARKAWVYEPPIAITNAYLQLPVLVLLSGVPGTPQDWLNGAGVKASLDSFAKDHGGVVPYVFMVDDTGSFTNDTECVNSPRGNVETYLTVDVPRYIHKNFNVSASPSRWAVGGLSMGGTCSIMLALAHQNVYRYFLDFGGDLGPSIGSEHQTIQTLFGGSRSAWEAHQPELLLKAKNAKKKYAGMGGFFAVGRSDTLGVTSANAKLYQLARADGLDVANERVPGSHTFAVWKQNFIDALPWLSNRLGATECTSGCQ